MEVSPLSICEIWQAKSYLYYNIYNVQLYSYSQHLDSTTPLHHIAIITMKAAQIDDNFISALNIFNLGTKNLLKTHNWLKKKKFHLLYLCLPT